MNYDTMTLDELRDEAARLTGHTRREPPGGGDPFWTHESSRDALYVHPLPPTLDAVAKAMPKGVMVQIRQGAEWWTAEEVTVMRGGWVIECSAVGPDELTARLRLLCKVLAKGAADGE